MIVARGRTAPLIKFKLLLYVSAKTEREVLLLPAMLLDNAFVMMMALVCAIVSTVLSVMQIRDHLLHNPLAAMRVFVNRILLMVPACLTA